MTSSEPKEGRIFILTGAVHSGKTSRLKRVVEELRNSRVILKGYLSLALLEKDNVIGYDLCDMEDGQVIPYIRKRGAKNWEKIGSYRFLPSGLSRAKAIISGGSDYSLLIVDEIGPLELRGQGVWPDLKKLIDRPSAFVLLVIRRTLLEDFLKLLPRDRVRVFDIREKDAHERLLKEILDFAPVP